MAKPMLIELPTGDFIDPDAVFSIQRFDASADGVIQERILISTTNGGVFAINFGHDREAAEAFRRDLGKQINSTRKSDGTFYMTRDPIDLGADPGPCPLCGHHNSP